MSSLPSPVSRLPIALRLLNPSARQSPNLNLRRRSPLLSPSGRPLLSNLNLRRRIAIRCFSLRPLLPRVAVLSSLRRTVGRPRWGSRSRQMSISVSLPLPLKADSSLFTS